jgi:hypothetical protein
MAFSYLMPGDYRRAAKGSRKVASKAERTCRHSRANAVGRGVDGNLAVSRCRAQSWEGRAQPAGAFVGWISSTTIPPPRGLDEST